MARRDVDVVVFGATGSGKTGLCVCLLDKCRVRCRFEDDLPEQWAAFKARNAAYFE